MNPTGCMACTIERKQREARGDRDEPPINVCPVHTRCRRCSECQGEEHHYLGPEMIGEDVGFICKHCELTCPAEECATCCELFPLDIMKQVPAGIGHLCPACYES